MKEKVDGITRSRRQRNFFAAVAVGLILVAMGVAFPRALARRQALKGANDELLRLQREIVAVQQQTRDVQAQILRTQDEIRVAQNQP